MIEIVPAIDLIDGKCVRLSQGEYASKKVYASDPLEVAKRIEAHGIRRLHVVDLDGAASCHVVNHATLERIAGGTGLVIDFGGGVKTDDDLRLAFDSGAAMVTAGSIAVTRPDVVSRWLELYGSERIILGADVKEGYIAVNGWQSDTDLSLHPFLDRYVGQGVNRVVCTDISRDGMLQGPAIDLYREVLQRHPGLWLMASGGVSSVDDIRALQAAGVPSVIFGKALYEGRITLRQLEEFIQ